MRATRTALLAAPVAASAGELSFTPYLWLPSVDGTVGAGTDRTLPPVDFDAFLGARGCGLTRRLGFGAGTRPAVSTSTSEIWVDAVTGFRFDARFAGKWLAHLRCDGGTGGSSLSWQGYAVGGYGFSWGDLVAGWRDLYVDRGGGNLRLRLARSGPLVGARFTFWLGAVVSRREQRAASTWGNYLP